VTPSIVAIYVLNTTRDDFTQVAHCLENPQGSQRTGRIHTEYRRQETLVRVLAWNLTRNSGVLRLPAKYFLHYNRLRMSDSISVSPVPLHKWNTEGARDVVGSLYSWERALLS